jgi:hypothetical protein
VEPVARPEHFWHPDRAGSYGAEAVDLAKLYGEEPDPEQHLAIDAIMSHRDDGSWTALEAAVIICRQNGKTKGVILPVVLSHLFLFEPDLMIWTAHRMDAAEEAFIAIRDIIDGTHELSRRTKKILEGNGEQSVELLNGARLEFKARASGGGRAMSAKTIVLDEAYKLSDASIGSLVPTLATRGGDAQILYGSSACHEDSAVLREIVNRGRGGGDDGLVYVEWAPPFGWEDIPCERGPRCTHHRNIPGCALDCEDYWYQANPALARGRIDLSFLRNVRRSMAPAEFGREFVGLHDMPDVREVSPITAEMWNAWADDQSFGAGRPCFAIDASPGSRTGAIVAAMAGSTDIPHLEVVEYGPGTEWVAARAAELQATHNPTQWVLDPTGPAGALLPDLADAGINIREMTVREMGQACQSLAKGGFRHTGDPILSTALECSARRDVGDGLWTWTRRKSGDISPLVAATAALWGLSTPQASVAAPWVGFG